MPSATEGSVRTLRAAGDTNPGLHREVNEDRFHFDARAGLFMVIDGVGGQAAGGKAADTAVAYRLREPACERETGPVAMASSRGDRDREQRDPSARRPAPRVERHGLRAHGRRHSTTAVRSSATSETRGSTSSAAARIEKVTRDHSPVGEREDAREISELDAMQHPRRNEVYRDVGSEPHEPADPDFIDVQEISFEPDAALLLCSDGLTDLVDSSSINQIVGRVGRAGRRRSSRRSSRPPTPRAAKTT